MKSRSLVIILTLLLLLPQGAEAFFLWDILCLLTLGFICLNPTNSDLQKYNLQLDLAGVSDEARLYYERGAQRWERIITGDVPDVTYFRPLWFASDPIPFSKGRCSFPTFNMQIDDLYQCVLHDVIDGLGDQDGDILGASNVFLIRTSSRLPAVSWSVFDVANVAQEIQQGSFQGTVNHELGHAVGIGYLWEYEFGCPSSSYNSSPKVNAEFQQLSGCDFPVPTKGNGFYHGCGQ